jgi:1-acyl-sn-glycerol-3-phosphate acyltransferase
MIGPDLDGGAASRAAERPTEQDRTGLRAASDCGHHASTTEIRGSDLPTPNAPAQDAQSRSRSKPVGFPLRDRSLHLWIWYHFVRYILATLTVVLPRWRATGQRNVPASGGVLLVCNHLSFLDVFFVGIPLRRPLNYVARSTLFVPLLGWFIRSVGGFPIQREGIGASGMKETLRRLKGGGIVTLFPEGTRSRDGELGAIKPGIAVLVGRVGVPVVPAGLAGTFEIWPRSRLIPVPHPVRVHYGRPILPGELAGLDTEAITALIRDRMQESHREACRALRSDMTY